MIAGLDSAYPPNDAQVAAAQADGVRVWGGYIATKAGVGLLNPWSQADFDRVRRLDGTPIGYCSGWDDPAAVAALAATWNVRLCLDIEDGIRGDGSWVQAWLDASGAGVYGNPGIPEKYTAPFKIAAAYPASGDPGITWPGSPPLEPHGWQWQGTHDEYGLGVDRGWFDDWFGSQEDDMKAFIVIASNGAQWAVLPNGFRFGITSQEDLAALNASGQFVQAGNATDAQLAGWPVLGAAPPASAPGVPGAPATLSVSLTGTATPQ